jgi:uncharacterized protein (TIGR02646 family)
MRRIVKRKPGPTKLVELHRQGKRFVNLDDDPRDKQHVRDVLLEDQGFLCCYCMRSIDPNKHQRVRIEHHQSQSSASVRDLDWNNLLAACAGARKLRGRAKDDAAARKVPRAEQTCDNRKGDDTITINPLTANVDAIRYLNDGRLQHRIAQLQEDIDERLNLNVDFLVDARIAARTELIERLCRKLGPTETWTATALERYLDARRRSPRLPQYFGLIETLLARWIAQRKR